MMSGVIVSTEVETMEMQSRHMNGNVFVQSMVCLAVICIALISNNPHITNYSSREPEMGQ